MKFGLSFAIMLAAASPAMAQNAVDLWDRFIDECTTALEAPFAGVLTALVSPSRGEGTVFTEDGKMFVGVKPLYDVETEGVAVASLTLHGEKHDSHQVSICTMLIVYEDPTLQLGFFEIAKVRAEAVLGEAPTIAGGKLVAADSFLGAVGDFTAYSASLTTPGPFPRPLSIRVQEVPRNATLMLTKITDLEDN